MPTETIYYPDRWFGVFHEMGHEHSSQLDLLHNLKIRKALSDAGLYSNASLEEASEVYSEIFACIYGFEGDFDRCLEKTWKYLNKMDDIQERLHFLFLRFLMTYIFMLEDGTTRYIHNGNEIQQVCREFREKLKDCAGSSVWVEDEDLRKISLSAKKLRMVLDAIGKLIPEQRYKKTKEDFNYAAFTKGRVLLEIGDPAIFLEKAAPKPLYFRQALAIILSLWNKQILESPR
ncbi:hypothetical protein ACFLWX_04525 [Chloroflexota bacterium]